MILARLRALWNPRRTLLSGMDAIRRERIRIHARLDLMVDRQSIRTKQNMPETLSMRQERELWIARLEELDIVAYALTHGGWK